MPEDNEQLRAARRAMISPVTGHPMSRDEIADAANSWLHRHDVNQIMTGDYIGKLERGRFRWPNKDYRAALRDVLNAATDADLGFTPPGGDSAASFDSPRPLLPAIDIGRRVITLDAGIDGLEVEEVDLVALSRRGFMTGLGGGVVAARLPAQAQAAGSTVPDALAEGMRSTAATYRAAYRMASARQLLAAAHGHLQLVLALRPADQPEQTRKQLLLAIGEMATLSGTVLGLDLARWNDSGPYFALADEIARETDNPELHTVVMACRAFQASYGAKDFQLGLDYAEAATGRADTGASWVTRGWAAAVASERHADLGDANASLRMLDQARAALDRASGDDRPYSGIGSFDDAKLIAYEGGNYRRLRRPGRAVATLDSALTKLDPSLHRHRATALIDRAEAQYDARRIDAACADTRSALTLVAKTHHANTLDRATTIARHLRATNTREANDLWTDLLTIKAAMMVAKR